MRKARFNAEGGVRGGRLEGDEVVTDEASFSVDDVDLLPPSTPSKVVAVGKNYADHAAELGTEVPDFPLLFFKPASAVVGPDDEIRYPPSSERVDYEGEVGLVIGRECRNVSEGEALDYVEGVTCVNDVTARDWQERENQWARAKGTDTFCPIGPCVQTDFTDSLDVETRVNGERVQSSNTENMVFGFAELVAEASRFMTLLPGDVVATGTPEGVGALEKGDVVVVEVEGVGTLRNPVA